jgi:hypothetical protein
VTRVMTEQRNIEVFAVIGEYALLGLLAYRTKYKLNAWRILYIFLVGVFVHSSMEFTLVLTGMRGSSLFDLVFNSLFEFNVGTPILYLMMFALVPYLTARGTMKKQTQLLSSNSMIISDSCGRRSRQFHLHLFQS